MVIRRLAIGLLLAAVMVAAAASPAAAHANLVGADPGDGEAVESGLGSLRLFFSEAVDLELSEVTVVDAAGTERPVPRIAHGLEPSTLVVELPELVDGVYGIEFRVVSSVDAHTTRGLTVVAIGDDASAAASSAFERPGSSPPWVETLMRWVAYGALVLVVGAGLAMATLLRAPGLLEHRRRGDIDASSAERGRWLVRGALAAVIAASVGQLLVQVVAIGGWSPGGVADTLDAMWGLPWTTWWVVRVVVSVVGLALVSGGPRPLPVVPVVALVSGFVGMVSVAAAGHAAASGGATDVAITVVHMIAIAAWLGSLASYRVLIPRSHSRLRTAALRSHGLAGGVGAAVTIISGLAMAGLHVPTIDALLNTTYGRVVAGKAALTVSALALGATVHWAVRQPRGGARMRLRRVLTTEVVLGVAAVAMAALLASSPTPNPLQWMAGVDGSAQGSMSAAVDDVVVTFDVAPNRIGSNLVTVSSASVRLPELAAVDRMIVTGISPEGVRVRHRLELTDAEASRYQGPLSLGEAGRWTFEVAVRRRGLPDAVATFDWHPTTTGITEAERVSNRDLAGTLAPVRDVVLVVTAAVLLWWVLGRTRIQRATRTVDGWLERTVDRGEQPRVERDGAGTPTTHEVER